MLELGSIAPNFKCKDHEDNERSLDAYYDKKLILFFYPRANTPGCSREVASFQQNLAKLLSLNFAILGVSSDTPKSNSAFAAKYHLSFPLLCDTDREVIEKYEADNGGKTRRITYIIERGIIKHATEKVNTTNAAEQILQLSAH